MEEEIDTMQQKPNEDIAKNFEETLEKIRTMINKIKELQKFEKDDKTYWTGDAGLRIIIAQAPVRWHGIANI